MKVASSCPATRGFLQGLRDRQLLGMSENSGVLPPLPVKPSLQPRRLVVDVARKQLLPSVPAFFFFF